MGTATPAGNNTYPASAGFTPSAAGTYWWFVSSGADSNNNAASSLCNSGSMTKTTVSLASPTLTTTLSANSITAGGTAYDTSTLSGGTASAGGTVTYSYWSNNTCTIGQVVVGSAVTVTSGVVPNSSVATFNSAGTYYWQAVYSGDANNNGASSTCTAITNEQLTVTSPATASVLVQGTSSPTVNITASSASTQLIAVYVHGNSGSPSASVATGNGTPFATESTIFTQGIVTSGSTKEYLVLIEATGRDVPHPVTVTTNETLDFVDVLQLSTGATVQATNGNPASGSDVSSTTATALLTSPNFSEIAFVGLAGHSGIDTITPPSGMSIQGTYQSDITGDLGYVLFDPAAQGTANFTLNSTAVNWGTVAVEFG